MEKSEFENEKEWSEEKCPRGNWGHIVEGFWGHSKDHSEIRGHWKAGSRAVTDQTVSSTLWWLCWEHKYRWRSCGRKSIAGRKSRKGKALETREFGLFQRQKEAQSQNSSQERQWHEMRMQGTNQAGHLDRIINVRKATDKKSFSKRSHAPSAKAHLLMLFFASLVSANSGTGKCGF